MRIIDWMTAITAYAIHDKAIQDLLFRNAALLSYLRANGFVPYNGGTEMNYLFTNGNTRGGPFAPGTTRNTDVIHPWSALQFGNRWANESINEHMENLLVNSGPYATFSSLEMLHRLAISSMNARYTLALYRHGQVTAAEDRSLYTCGLEDGLNDGITPSYFGNLFPTYGNVSRTATSAAPGLSSTPFFAGNPTTGAKAKLTYTNFLKAYTQFRHGSMTPKLIIANKGGYTAMLTSIDKRQRIVDMVESPHYGVKGIKFMDAVILEDEYAPSAAHPVDALTINELGSNVTPSSISYDATTVSARSNLQLNSGGESATFVPGEVIFFLNTETLYWRNATEKMFAFGFGGYEKLPTSNQIHGAIQNMGTLHSHAPWCSGYLYGITDEGE